jgi:hypothetical protein
MVRPKRNSTTLERASRRLESLQSIDPQLDLGGSLTLQNFATAINHLAIKLSAYNTTLSTVDKMADDIKQSEAIVKAMAEKMLMGVGSHYGRSSQEYEMAGGSRRRRQSTTESSTAAAS